MLSLIGTVRISMIRKVENDNLSVHFDLMKEISFEYEQSIAGCTRREWCHYRTS